MPRYVDLDKLPLVAIDVDTINGGAFVDLREVQQALRQAEAQTGEVAPVVHGFWMPIDDGLSAKCGICGAYVYDLFEGFEKFAKSYRYCQRCGAKMDGEEDWSECCSLIPREEAQDD